VVAGVVSLHDFRPKAQAHRLGTFRKTKATGESSRCSRSRECGSGGAQPCYAVGPGDFAKIYNLPTATRRTGVTIAIVQDSNINVADVTQFRSLFGLPQTFSTSNIILNGPDPGIQGPDSATGDESSNSTCNGPARWRRARPIDLVFRKIRRASASSARSFRNLHHRQQMHRS